MQVVWGWDDGGGSTDGADENHAYNLHACASCGKLLKVQVWDQEGQEDWIDQRYTPRSHGHVPLTSPDQEDGEQ